MKDRKINTNKLNVSKFVYITVFFLFAIFIVALIYRCLADYKVGDITFSDFISNRNIVEEVIMPDRGTIFDSKGNVLAQNVSSYTLIAYLDESRSENSDEIRHVKDKESTALALSELIDTPYERILELLNKDAYQVEFGTGGKNLSQLEMEAIKSLKLPGIDFIKSTKRYYPNGDFASYLLGYTKVKADEDGNEWIVSDNLGIEETYNDVLTGETGYLTYERDGRGNKIVNSNEYKEEALNGANVNLTIDNSVQLFIENAVKNSQEQSEAEWTLMAVMEASTGAILGYASTPSYDPNIRNLTNFMDPLISFDYEPGSTMKTFSYMCAIESGKYDGDKTFLSGSKTYEAVTGDSTVTIKDWNGKGWGTISFDRGYAMSSNIGVATLLEDVITKQQLKDCYEKYGFGKLTGIKLYNEIKGNVKFNYDVEAATAGYGQGIRTTPIQMLQALTSVANDGIMLKPYVVSSVVSSEGKVLEKNEKTEVGRVASSATIKKIKELMSSVVVPDSNFGTGAAYYMEDYDLIGKTGTASIYDYEKGKYLTGESEYIYSFSGLYPGDNPELIIYMAIKRPKNSVNYVAPAVKDVIVNLSKYYNIETNVEGKDGYKISNYVNKTVSEIKGVLTENNIEVITLGNGNKVVAQYPNNGITLYDGDRIILLTNNYDNTMINLIGMSYKDVKNTLELVNVKYKLDGYGYVYEQSVAPGDKIGEEVILKLEGKY